MPTTRTTTPKPKPKPKPEQQPAVPPRIVGLDLHPDIFSAAVLEGGRPLSARVVHSADAVPFARLADWARENLREGDLVVCEAGSNSFEALARLRALGHAAVCLESRRVGQVRESGFNDDRGSAEKIARIYLSGLCKSVWEPDAKTRVYRELSGLYAEAVRGATRARNSLRAGLNERGVRLPKGALHTAAAEEAALCAYAWCPLGREILADHFAQVRHTEARRKALYAKMCGVLARDPHMLWLTKLLGINVVNAFALCAAVGDVRRFASPKKLCAYLGVAGRRDTSGATVDKKKGCAGAGRADLRALLVQSAQSVLNSRRGGALREWGWKVFARRGSRNIAIIAIARKLAVAVWYELMGLGAPAARGDETLRRKLRDLCKHLGGGALEEAGVTTKGALAEKLFEKLATQKNRQIQTST